MDASYSTRCLDAPRPLTSTKSLIILEYGLMKTRLPRLFVSFTLLLVANLALAETGSPGAANEAESNSVPLVTALQRLQASLQIPTVSDTLAQEETQAAFRSHRELLERAYPKTFSTLKSHDVGPFSVLLEWAGSDAGLKGSVLMAHQDVVPVDSTNEWSHPPFSGVEAEGYVWGRGAQDNKSGVIGILEAVETLVDQGYQPRRTLWLVFGHDEETDGSNGAAHIAAYMQKNNVQVDTVLDEGLFVSNGLFPGLNQPLALIGVAEKGYLSVDLTFNGEGGHSSVPPANSAIARMGEFAHRLEQKKIPPVMTPPMRALIEILAPLMPQPQRFVMQNTGFFESMLLHQLSQSKTAAPLVSSTIAMTMAKSGVKDNVVPASATLTVNARILPGQTEDDVIKHLEMNTMGFDVEITPREATFSPLPSSISCFSCSHFKTIESVITDVFPTAVVGPGLVTGGTDSRHFRELTDNIYRFLPIIVGPEDVEGFHGKDEKISIENYNRMIEFYKALIQAWDKA